MLEVGLFAAKEIHENLLVQNNINLIYQYRVFSLRDYFIQLFSMILIFSLAISLHLREIRLYSFRLTNKLHNRN